mmetsp:Transcript_12272/g.34174  ORF Transcript_12272/g.34174 Transcript_12272/m.34174 type:complete len:207 (-) Transcript_12272:1048-1668(-)
MNARLPHLLLRAERPVPPGFPLSCEDLAGLAPRDLGRGAPRQKLPELRSRQPEELCPSPPRFPEVGHTLLGVLGSGGLPGPGLPVVPVRQGRLHHAPREGVPPLLPLQGRRVLQLDRLQELLLGPQGLLGRLGLGLRRDFGLALLVSQDARLDLLVDEPPLLLHVLLQGLALGLELGRPVGLDSQSLPHLGQLLEDLLDPALALPA